VPVPFESFDMGSRDALMEEFERVYASFYGHVMQAPAELISWRVIAHGPQPELMLGRQKVADGADPAEAVKGQREIYIPADKRMRPVPVYDRYKLSAGCRMEGPMIVEERESTVVINGPGAVFVDEFANLIVDLRHGG